MGQNNQPEDSNKLNSNHLLAPDKRAGNRGQRLETGTPKGEREDRGRGRWQWVATLQSYQDSYKF